MRSVRHTRARVVLLSIVMVFTSTLTVQVLGFHLVTTPSLPRGLYRTITLPFTPGTLVVFCPSPALIAIGKARGYLAWGTCPGAVQPLVKPIGAVAGDIVEIQPDSILVNGIPLPHSATVSHDAHGRPLPHMPWGTYHVAVDEFWVFSTHIPTSWDSRYFGPISRASILSAAQPVWTVNE